MSRPMTRSVTCGHCRARGHSQRSCPLRHLGRDAAMAETPEGRAHLDALESKLAHALGRALDGLPRDRWTSLLVEVQKGALRRRTWFQRTGAPGAPPQHGEGEGEPSTQLQLPVGARAAHPVHEEDLGRVVGDLDRALGDVERLRDRDTDGPRRLAVAEAWRRRKPLA